MDANKKVFVSKLSSDPEVIIERLEELTAIARGHQQDGRKCLGFICTTARLHDRGPMDGEINQEEGAVAMVMDIAGNPLILLHIAKNMQENLEDLIGKLESVIKTRHGVEDNGEEEVN